MDFGGPFAHESRTCLRTGVRALLRKSRGWFAHMTEGSLIRILSNLRKRSDIEKVESKGESSRGVSRRE